MLSALPMRLDAGALQLRAPLAADGTAVHRLVRDCPPLDANSLYCNLLQCTHFAATSIVAEVAGDLIAFVAGYRLPARNDTLFVWQVAVSPAARGHGLGLRALRALLARPACVGIRHVETTITPSNRASWHLFEALARSLDSPLALHPLFDRDAHLGGGHESEMGVRIGPIPRAARTASERRTP